ncbi:MAG: YaiI/YqxD family protein [Thermaerobacter sp.]|nr:YaiI/YqxD family protein [Thermaerobacter sp.]
MQILVDADACPVKQIIVRLAKQRSMPVTMLIDTSHELHDGYSRIITVDKQADSVDFALMSLLTREDIVVTQDFGLAAMAIGKGAKAVNQNGLVFTDDNIDKLLMERHIGQKIRRGGGRAKGPAKRTKEDDARFETALFGLMDRASLTT